MLQTGCPISVKPWLWHTSEYNHDPHLEVLRQTTKHSAMINGVWIGIASGKFTNVKNALLVQQTYSVVMVMVMVVMVVVVVWRWWWLWWWCGGGGGG